MNQLTKYLYADVAELFTDNPYTATILAVALYGFETLYGPSTLTKHGMILLLLLIIADWVGGFSAAKKDGIDTSAYGLEGLSRTALLMMLPAIANYFDMFFMTQGLATYFMIAAMARHLTKSVIANVYRNNWTSWIPVDMLNFLVDWVKDELAHKDARAARRYQQLHNRERDEE